MSTDRVKYLRRYLLVHSYLYYVKDDSIISDDEWTKHALELIELQKSYTSRYEAKQFKDFTTPSGYHFKYSMYIRSAANYLYKLHKDGTLDSIRNKDYGSII
jgi:hypothetical protein